MSADSKQPPALSDKKVLERVQWLLEEGTVDRTFHFARQAEERNVTQNVTQVDIEVLLTGECSVASKEYSSEHKSWKYKIEGFDDQGDSLSVVVSLDISRSILKLITVF